MLPFGLPKTALFLGAALVSCSCANAELGGSMSSVAADGVRMGAQTASAWMGNYTRHSLTRSNGGNVHELTNAAGQVFAVTWSGPGKPDLRVLLGSYFSTFQTVNGATGRSMHGLRNPPQVNQSDLQIQTAGHMGWFRGVALIPSLVPPGFSASNLAEEK